MWVFFLRYYGTYSQDDDCQRYSLNINLNNNKLKYIRRNNDKRNILRTHNIIQNMKKTEILRAIFCTIILGD